MKRHSFVFSALLSIGPSGRGGRFPEETMEPAPAPGVLPFRILLLAAALFLSSVLFPG
jgi:hypothetical protein